MSRRSSVQHIYSNLSFAGGIENSRTQYQRGKMRQRRKGRATIGRKNAFLDMVAAVERKKREPTPEMVEALGDRLKPFVPIDVEAYVNRYRDSVEEQKRVFRN